MLLTRFLGARAACAWTGNVSGVVEFLVSIRYYACQTTDFNSRWESCLASRVGVAIQISGRKNFEKLAT